MDVLCSLCLAMTVALGDFQVMSVFSLYHAWVMQPIANLGFGLAAHGIASLGVECELDLVADWGLNVTLAYGTSSGISVNFTNPAWPAFSADVGIVVAPGVPCEVSGTIGFLGADIVLDSKFSRRALTASAIQHPSEKGGLVLWFSLGARFNGGESRSRCHETQ